MNTGNPESSDASVASSHALDKAVLAVRACETALEGMVPDTVFEKILTIARSLMDPLTDFGQDWTESLLDSEDLKPTTPEALQAIKRARQSVRHAGVVIVSMSEHLLAVSQTLGDLHTELVRRECQDLASFWDNIREDWTIEHKETLELISKFESVVSLLDHRPPRGRIPQDGLDDEHELEEAARSSLNSFANTLARCSVGCVLADYDLTGADELESNASGEDRRAAAVNRSRRLFMETEASLAESVRTSLDLLSRLSLADAE